MPSDDAGLSERIVTKLRLRYPSPLDMLLVELYERNKDYWLQPPMDGTIGAERVREYGLTENQMRWADEVAEQMDGDHPTYADIDMLHVEDEEIVADVTASEVVDSVE